MGATPRVTSTPTFANPGASPNKKTKYAESGTRGLRPEWHTHPPPACLYIDIGKPRTTLCIQKTMKTQAGFYERDSGLGGYI